MIRLEGTRGGECPEEGAIIRTWSLLCLPLLLVLAGCREDPELLQRRVVELRTQRGALMEAMFAEYSGPDTMGSLLHRARTSATDGGSGQAGAVVAEVAWAFAENFVGSIEEDSRARFATSCRTLGHGDRPAGLSPDERDFFARPDVRDGCQRVVGIDVAIEAAEAKLARALGRG